jgi:hypothetical protein
MISKLCNPLQPLPFLWTVYCKFYLDGKGNCKQLFTLGSEPESLAWMVFHYFEISSETINLIKSTPLYATNYSLWEE